MSSLGIYKNDGDFDVYVNIADIPELNVVKVKMIYGVFQLNHSWCLLEFYVC